MTSTDYTPSATALESRPEDPSSRQGVQKLSQSFCASQYAASLKCLDDSDYDKSKCQDQFDAYKACRKQEGTYETSNCRIAVTTIGKLGVPVADNKYNSNQA